LGDFLDRYRLTPGYLLAVGSLQPRKNVRRLLRTFFRWRTGRSSGVRLVLTGAITWKSEDVIADVEAQPGAVVRLGHVSAEDLPALYTAAGALAFPSLYEGFGLPILEAMACGTPVLTSDCASCPEVAGKAALFVDPEDDDALYEGIDRILGDTTLRRSLRMRGFDQAGKFSWRRTARRYLDMFQRGGH
jgi:glycosyltransferase involved in cell wall biosynthesis